MIFELSDKGYFVPYKHLEQLPIPPITPENRPIAQRIESLVDRILKAKEQNPQADIFNLEGEIDRLVYKLYDLTPEETGIVERQDLSFTDVG